MKKEMSAIIMVIIIAVIVFGIADYFDIGVKEVLTGNVIDFSK